MPKKASAKKKTKKAAGGGDWNWPWQPEEEEKWGADIIAKYGELTDLDRRLHGHLSLMDQGKSTQAEQGRWHLESSQYQLAMRRREGKEVSLGVLKTPSNSEVLGTDETKVGSDSVADVRDGDGATCEGAAGGDHEPLKREGNELYVKGDHEAAIVKYGEAIKVFEAAKSDDPRNNGDRQALAVLYSNRAQAALAIVRKARSQPGNLSKELRKSTMLALTDASQAVELDEANAKAWLRKGQALLWLSTLQQRASEAVRCLEKAKAGSLPESLKPELAQWLQFGRAVFDRETPMPEQCPQM